MQLVSPPDLELWACRYLAGKLKGVSDLTVTNRVPDRYDGTRPLIAVRDDGGTQAEGAMFERRLGVTVCYGNSRQTKRCRDLAARVYALLTWPGLIHVDGSPIAAIVFDECNGPYRIITSMDVSRQYLIVDYRVDGDIENFKE